VIARAVAGALAATAIVSLAACTSSGSPSADDSATPPLTAPSVTVPTDTPTSDPATSATSSATASHSPTKTVAPDISCTMAQLRLTAVRGSGFQGREFAQIVFTNKSAKKCTLFGFPGVSLRRAGALLGQPATREPVTPKTVTLRPGESATSDITDFSTCNAPRSDTVRVYPPDSKLFVDLPLDLRGCTISVRPVVHE
jgi:hypothetical protein